MWVGSDVGYNGHRNGVYEKPVSVISCCIFDTNVVGASHRGAHPGRRFFCSRADAQHLASETLNDLSIVLSFVRYRINLAHLNKRNIRNR